MKIALNILILFWIFINPVNANFKEIKKKATVKNSNIIFPVKTLDIKSCSNKMRLDPQNTKFVPIEFLDAPKGYGLDDRFNSVRKYFEKFSMPCGNGNIEACKKVKEVILIWAKADAPKRKKNGDLWNDTLTINLHINSPMMASYSFARQLIDFTPEEKELIENWFKKSVKRGKHLMYDKTYGNNTQARGTPKRAHNHALSSAIAHMELGVILNDDKLFRLAFKNYEAAIKYQRKDGSLPIEVRRGGRAMFYQGRAMNTLAVIAIIAENQGYDIWNLDFKGKNFHNLVKFFIDFTEDNEIVFKYAKEMRAPGPAKNYKLQDLSWNRSSNWGWLYAYATRFPDHANIQRIIEWSNNKNNLNKYQKDLVLHYENIGKMSFRGASWTVVQANCHFLK